MPCATCGKIQTDPVKGASPWARGVKGGEQILVCPDCQAANPSWTGDLDGCPVCKGTRLSKVMGSLLCRDCGFEGEPPSS